LSRWREHFLGDCASAQAAPQRISLVAFLQELQQLGWADGRNIRVDIGWGARRAHDATVGRTVTLAKCAG
jgi:hypothetical protein